MKLIITPNYEIDFTRFICWNNVSKELVVKSLKSNLKQCKNIPNFSFKNEVCIRIIYSPLQTIYTCLIIIELVNLAKWYPGVISSAAVNAYTSLGEKSGFNLVVGKY